MVDLLGLDHPNTVAYATIPLTPASPWPARSARMAGHEVCDAGHGAHTKRGAVVGRIRVGVVVVAVGAAFVVQACSGSSTPAKGPSTTAAAASGTPVSAGPTTTQGPKVGGTLRFGLESDVSTLDDAQALSQPADKAIALSIYDPLASYDDTGNVVPYLASAITHSSDSATWTVTLRQGITFSDGTPLNADAVVAHFKRLQDPATKSYWSTDADKFTVTAPDENTVVFHLSAPNVAFAQDLCGTEGYIESPTAAKAEGADFARKPVGTGPFILKEYVTGDHVLVTKNPTYWKKDANGA